MNTALCSPNTGLKVEASINPSSIQATGGATWPRLMLQVLLRISEQGDAYRKGRVQATSFGMLTGELVIGAETIAHMRPVAINRHRPGNLGYATDEHPLIEMELDARRIEWIEQQRAGKSFEAKLRISLQTHVFGDDPRSPGSPFGLVDASAVSGDIPLTCPDAQWREKVLPGLGYGKVIAIELPAVGLESCKALEHSFLALEKAQKQFLLGHYDDAVGACRVALDPFFELVEKEGEPKRIPKLKRSWEVSLGAATYQWLDSALGAVKTAANKPHHSPNCHFDRLGAQMLITVTTNLVAYAARQQASEEHSLASSTQTSPNNTRKERA